jgi:hypothetical protein
MKDHPYCLPFGTAFSFVVLLCLIACAMPSFAAQGDNGSAAKERAQTMVKPLPFDIKLDTVHKEFDGSFCWFHPRIGAIPGAGLDGQPAVVMTLQKWFLSASDFFSALSDMRTDDLGASWTGPKEHEELAWREIGENSVEGVCDFTPGWHAPSGKLLAIGHTVRYKNDKLMHDPRPRSTSYSVYDPKTREWSPWDVITMPDTGEFFSAGAGCAQWITEPDGTLLVPFYFKAKSTGGKSCYSAAAMRCTFDGTKITYVEHGKPLTLDVPRGFCEPSLTWFQGRYYMTLRNDVRGYIATSEDGLNYTPSRPWTFDDGKELGSYNTQQHWATHSDALFLVYTRRGADNDHIVRNRAPLFIAQIDPGKLVVLRDTERVVIPKRGAMLGNFGVTSINENETWVTVGEGMYQADKITEGADGSVFAGRILWSKPNRLATGDRRIP